MGWKDLKSWLKGGIIGGLFGFIASVLFVIKEIFNLSSPLYLISSYIVSPILYPTIVIANILDLFIPASFSMNRITEILVIILSIIFYFAVGAIIGLIIRKIKSK